MAYEHIGDKQEQFLRKKKYLEDGQSVEDRYEQIVNRVKDLQDNYPNGAGLSARILRYLEEGILSPSTPVLANFGKPRQEGSTSLPVSCNIISVENSVQGIYGANLEAAMLSKLGAGVGIDFSFVSDKGTEISPGFFTNPKMDWIEPIIDTTQKISQGAQRRGYGVPFIEITDPEYFELMTAIDKSNPDSGGVLVDNNVGIKIPKGFMGEISTNKNYQKRLQLALKNRVKSGQVYLCFLENMDKNKSPVYEKLGHTPNTTNICTEAMSPNYKDKTFSCVLSSLNLNHVDEILANDQIVKDCFTFLDIINEEYIILSEGVVGLEKARRSAMEKRDIGLGVLGFHEMLQRKGYAFGDLQSRALNAQIFSYIRDCGEEYTKELAEFRGSCPMAEEAGLTRANVSLMMVAPNKSTAFLCGATSGGIEPFISNCFTQSLAGIQTEFKNPHLEKVLEEKGKNNFDVWLSITRNLGSVQHLDFLSDREKDVFRTFSEISPKDMIDLAADRQEFIDMGQSFNLMNRPNYSQKDIFKLHKYAYDKGIKTLYYFLPQAHAAIEKEGESWDSCVSCAD